MTIEIQFPVWIILESKEPGTSSPVTCTRNGALCLALFDDNAAELRFRADERPAKSANGQREDFTADELRFFLNQYNYVAVNPCSAEEVIFTAQELCDYLNRGSGTP